MKKNQIKQLLKRTVARPRDWHLSLPTRALFYFYSGIYDN